MCSLQRQLYPDKKDWANEANLPAGDSKQSDTGQNLPIQEFVWTDNDWILVLVLGLYQPQSNSRNRWTRCASLRRKLTSEYRTTSQSAQSKHLQGKVLLDMLSKRIDDKRFLNLIQKWLKAGIMETDGQVSHPVTGTPQGGVVSPILANIYLHHVLDEWFEETVRKHCRGQIYLCRYADDFVCAFEDARDAKRFYKALGQRLDRYGLQVAEDKTRIIEFSYCKVRVKTHFDFLGFEFRWGVTRWGKPQLKRRTSRDKLRASLAKFKEWFKKNVRLPKKILFAKLNRKLQGYYN